MAISQVHRRETEQLLVDTFSSWGNVVNEVRTLAPQSGAHRGVATEISIQPIQSKPSHPTYNSGARKPIYMRVQKHLRVVTMQKNAWRHIFFSENTFARHLAVLCSARYSQVQCWKDLSCATYIFKKQGLWGYVKYVTERDHLGTTWRLLKDYLLYIHTYYILEYLKTTWTFSIFLTF